MKPYKFFSIYLCFIIVLTSCSNDSEPKLQIELSHNSVILNKGNEAYVDIYNVNIDDCKATSSDNFVAEGYIFNNRLQIIAWKVGSADITISSPNSAIVCHVTVNSLINEFRDPIRNFGISKLELKNQLTNVTIKNEGTDYRGNYYIEVYDDSSSKKFYQSDRYYFDNDKLVLIRSEINKNFYNTAGVRVHTKMLEYLMDRYKPLSGDYWFEYPYKYVLNLVIRSGNGGYYIYYAPDMSIINSFTKN